MVQVGYIFVDYCQFYSGLGGENMNVSNKRPAYTEFMAWMLLNNVKRKELSDLLSISPSSLSQRLNGTGADFTPEEIRTLVKQYGKEIGPYFYF